MAIPASVITPRLYSLMPLIHLLYKAFLTREKCIYSNVLISLMISIALGYWFTI